MTAAIRNPILPGFHHDPSICRVGEDYYIANSTFGTDGFVQRREIFWRTGFERTTCQMGEIPFAAGRFDKFAMTSLLQSGRGNVHAGDRCVLGRETCLQRVEWRDGWLRLASGGAKPQDSLPVPKESCPQVWPTLPPRDDFDADKLDARWSSLRVPVDDSWLSLSKRPDWLRLHGRDSLFSLFTQSLIARRVQHVKFSAGTWFEFSPTQFSASSDGQSWRNIGPMLDFAKLSDDYGSTLRFTGAMVGLCAQDVGGTRAVADFDYFDYKPAKS